MILRLFLFYHISYGQLNTLLGVLIQAKVFESAHNTSLSSSHREGGIPCTTGKKNIGIKNSVFSFRIIWQGDPSTQATMMWQSTLPTAQLLPVASAPVIISPHRSNGINAGFVLAHSPVPEAVSCRKAFPISEEETDGGISGAITAALPY